MKKQVCSFLSLSTVALLLGVGAAGAQTQDTQRPGQAPTTQDPRNQQIPDAPPNSTPRQGDGTADRPTDNPADNPNQTPVSSSQTFTGTIARTGDKLVLQDTGGTTYDLDNQEAVKDFEGKKVKLHGVLDTKTNMIHITQQ